MDRRLAVAVEGRVGGGRFERADGGGDAVAVRAGQDVPARLNGFYPFGFVAQGNTGNPEPVGLFLHAAGIGEEHARGLFEGDDVEIAQGIDEPKRGMFNVQSSRLMNS